MPHPTRKPRKPYPDFPLFPHASGRWCKKVRGRFCYFGKVADDPDGKSALDLWLQQRDYLLAGRTPPVTAEGLSVRDLVNRFLTRRKHKMDRGEIKPRTFRDLHATAARLVNTFGRERLVVDLTAADFEHLANVMAETLGLLSRKTEIQKTRSVFKWAYDEGLIDRPIRYGQAFRPPSKKEIRRAKGGNGGRMFETREIRAMLDAATPQFKAMILLGGNCGYGNTDVATLPLAALDLDGGWVDHARPKTGAPRRCPLWPETVQALRKAIAKRPKPKDPADDRLVFLTQQGNPWVRLQGNGWNDAVRIVCRELLAKLGLKRPGRNFYALRHSFATVAGDRCRTVIGAEELAYVVGVEVVDSVAHGGG